MPGNSARRRSSGEWPGVNLPPFLLGTLLLVGLLLLAVGPGRRLPGSPRLDIPDNAERSVLAVGRGSGVLQAVPFALFAPGVGRPVAARFGTL